MNPTRTKIYVGGYSLSSPVIEYCSLNSDGTIADDCVATGGDAFSSAGTIWSMALNNTGTMAYVAAVTGSLYSCSIDLDGSLSGCSSLENAGVSAIAFNSGNNEIYTVRGDNFSAQQCSVNLSGEITSCSDISTFSASHPIAISFNSIGSKAYIVDYTVTPHSIYYCDTNSSDGTFTNCTLTASISTIYGIALNSTSTLVYIASYGNVQYCPVNTDGSLGTCAIAKDFSELPIYRIAIA
ncbi:MAG: hypothetical protein K5Q00_02550 [Gammaproteobacteria bacterium]|nr:hypothetical protein [Gammaproteobacteria bacterium]